MRAMDVLTDCWFTLGVCNDRTGATVSDTGWVACFGGGALVVLALIQSLRLWRDRDAQISKGFARSFVIVFIASMAVFLVVTDATGEELAAAFTVLGTLAGYSVGNQPGASSKKITSTDGTVTTITE